MRFGDEACEHCDNYVNMGPNWVPWGDTWVNEGDDWQCRLGYADYEECRKELPPDELPDVAV